jgi:hypothetical protein
MKPMPRQYSVTVFVPAGGPALVCFRQYFGDCLVSVIRGVVHHRGRMGVE